MAIWNSKRRVPGNWLIILWIILGIIFFSMRYFDSFLTNEVALHGIVSFEFAHDIDETNRVLDSWDMQAHSAAGLSLGLDFLYIMVYVVLFSAHVFNLNRRLYVRTGYRTIGKAALYAPVIAGLADIVENIALIQQMLEIPSDFLSNVAYISAFTKFTLIGFTAVYFVFGLLMILSKK